MIKLLSLLGVQEGLSTFVAEQRSLPCATYDAALILDTKYKPRYGAGTLDMDDIRQLAGYARDRKVLKRLGIQEAGGQDSAVVPCVIIYPEVRGVDVKFDGSRSPIDQVWLEVAPMEALVGFYRIGFPLPVLSVGAVVAFLAGGDNR